jgi:coenzyme F420-reducing hydrogenase beta subunit
MKGNKPSIDRIGIDNCMGCFGCKSACSKKAIEIILDKDGFYKPIIDRVKCSECGVCQSSCPVIMGNDSMMDADETIMPKAYAAWTNEENIRLASSSGGAFSELAKKVIESGGKVAGCVWSNKWTPMHILTDYWPDIERMRKSKYVPSNLGDIYKEVICFIDKSNKKVLFSGTPCQITAMKAALRPEQRKNVLLVEFICHGVPSLRVFHRYLEELFDGEDVVSYDFRNKEMGWQTILAISSAGKKYHIPGLKDPFFLGFVEHHLYMMESCYKCQFACTPRNADITLGDFWGCPEKWNDKRGVSIILVSTKKGMSSIVFAQKCGQLILKQVSYEESFIKNERVRHKYSKPDNRVHFFRCFAKDERFEKLSKKYYPSKNLMFWNEFRNSKSKIDFFIKLLCHQLGVSLK